MTETQSELNQILYGPPGTGKTYATIEAALKIVAPDDVKNIEAKPNMTVEQRRIDLKELFDEFVEEGYIRFVTFHQSFSYEDFVEGIRATVNADTKQTEYGIEDGVFKALCKAAACNANTGTGIVSPYSEAIPLHQPLPAFDGRPLTVIRKNPQIWKISLGRATWRDVRPHCMKNGEARIDWNKAGDLRVKPRNDYFNGLAPNGGQRMLMDFYQEIQKGDIFVCFLDKEHFCAVGIVAGDYQYDPIGGRFQKKIYPQLRSMRWIYNNLNTEIKPLNGGSILTLSTLYRLDFTWNKLRDYLIKQNAQPADSVALKTPEQPHVMVIDDTDRGTVYGIDPKIWTELTKNRKEAAAPNTPSVLVIDETDRSEVDGITHGKVFELDRNTWNELRKKLEEMNLQFEQNRLQEKNTESSDTSTSDSTEQTEASAASENEQADTSAQDFTPPAQPREPYVLIIDEINRGNVSRIFGELITLIEPDKRDGQPEALSVCLPYSKETFSVPDNVYLIGTMNTADRSLAGLDIALRRRFSFVEMPPRPELLKGINVEGVNIGELLQVMNERIELLLDRDHCLGHAYFMPLITTPSLPVLPVLGSIFRNKIIPLLQEYFFEDWQRIQWVLNDHRKPNAEHRFVQQPAPQDELFGEGVNVNEQNRRWTINDAAFGKAEAYQGIIGVNGLPDVSQTGENGAAPQ